MRKLVLLAILGGLLWQSEEPLDACGAKFLVTSRGGRYQKVLANIQPTRILWWYEENEDTPEDERWDPDTEKWLRGLGHTLQVTFDADAFLAEARRGEFDVILVGIDEARRLQQEIESLAPDAALLPILKFPTQSQYSAARSEFDIVMKLPTTSPKFLAAIEKARRSVRF